MSNRGVDPARALVLPFGAMAKTLSNRDLKQLLSGLESQGFRIKRTSEGYRLYPDNGSKILTLHLSVSDSRGMKNLRADVRRAGYHWPLD